jgi:hypothetical protein
LLSPSSPSDADRRGSVGSLWLQAFRYILERDDIDEHTDFFQAGGYSLLVPQLLAHYESLAGWLPPTRMIFEYPSPSELEEASEAYRQADPDGRR